MSDLLLSLEEAKQADNLATKDCTHLWNLVIMLEKLQIIDDTQTIKSSELFTYNFYREVIHLKDIRPDLTSQLNTILEHIRQDAF